MNKEKSRRDFDDESEPTSLHGEALGDGRRRAELEELHKFRAEGVDLKRLSLQARSLSSERFLE